MRLGGADGGDDALADARDDGFFARAADQAFDVGADGYAGLRPQLDAVLGDGGDHRRLDNLGVDAHLDGLQHVAARQVNGARLLKLQRDIRALRGNQGVDDAVHVAAGQVMGLHFVQRHVQARLGGLNERVDQPSGHNPANPHANQRGNAHLHARRPGGNPEPYRDEAEKDDEQD